MFTQMRNFYLVWLSETGFQINFYILIMDLQATAHRGLGFFNTLLIQYYSVICCPSYHTVGRSQAEIRTQDGRSRVRDSNHYRPPHLLNAGLEGRLNMAVVFSPHTTWDFSSNSFLKLWLFSS